MKKFNIIIALVAMATVSLTMISCGGSGSKSKAKGPASIEMSILEQIQKGNPDKAFDIWFDNVDKDEADGDINTYKNDLKEIFMKSLATNDQQGGVKEVELVEEKISEDGLTAKVTTKTTYGDGTSEESTSKYIFVNNAWKIDMNR